MRKRNILSLAGAAGVATLSYMLKDKSRRDNVKNKFNNIKKSFKKQDTGLPMKKQGGILVKIILRMLIWLQKVLNLGG